MKGTVTNQEKNMIRTHSSTTPLRVVGTETLADSVHPLRTHRDIVLCLCLQSRKPLAQKIRTVKIIIPFLTM